jgi:hypothetical protein
MFEDRYPQPLKKTSAQLRLARWIMRECGVAAAARYMKDCGWTIEAALFNLLGIARRDHAE